MILTKCEKSASDIGLSTQMPPASKELNVGPPYVFLHVNLNSSLKFRNKFRLHCSPVPRNSGVNFNELGIVAVPCMHTLISIFNTTRFLQVQPQQTALCRFKPPRSIILIHLNF